jgi:hypothetical protein
VAAPLAAAPSPALVAVPLAAAPSLTSAIRTTPSTISSDEMVDIDVIDMSMRGAEN